MTNESRIYRFKNWSLVIGHWSLAIGHWSFLLDLTTLQFSCPPGPPAWGASLVDRSRGFRHSSTHSRHVGRGIPLESTSWKNRPYHADWFLGSFLGDDLIEGRVSQDNELIGGVRLGWDFDYYWGLEWRFGWSDPNIQAAGVNTATRNGSIFLSDIDLVYYPWGDSKLRPMV
jgi:hypothetical protein